MFVAYLRTFGRMGLKAIPMRAETGPIGGDLSHEFIVLAETGESAVYCDKAVLDLPIPPEDVDYAGDLTPIIDQWTAPYAATEDVHDAARFQAETPEDRRIATRGIEVGQVFFFGDKYSKPMRAVVATPDGGETPVQMGSYGVGVSRLLGAIIEASHDDHGIIWPDAVAPFGVAIVNLRPSDRRGERRLRAGLRRADHGGRRAPDGRQRRAPRRQVRHHGPHRFALAAGDRTQGPEGRGGGAEAPRHGGEAEPAAGGCAEGVGRMRRGAFASSFDKLRMRRRVERTPALSLILSLSKDEADAGRQPS